MSHFALGALPADINVYVEKAPPVNELWGETPEQGHCRALQQGEIRQLGDLGGNGWRKVFNVYAKLLYDLPRYRPLRIGISTWQQLRDEKLLQAQSQTSLTFGECDILQKAQRGGVHIIAGRTHALQLGVSEQCVWLDNEFARHPTLPILICPYFDYRQLSNAKIEILIKLINGLD